MKASGRSKKVVLRLEIALFLRFWFWVTDFAQAYRIRCIFSTCSYASHCRWYKLNGVEGRWQPWLRGSGLVSKVRHPGIFFDTDELTDKAYFFLDCSAVFLIFLSCVGSKRRVMARTDGNRSKTIMNFFREPFFIVFHVHIQKIREFFVPGFGRHIAGP